MKSNLSTVLISFALLSFPLSVRAQLGTVPMPEIAAPSTEGPSLEQTLGWIKEKIEDVSNDQTSSIGRDFVINGCSVVHYELHYWVAPPVKTELSMDQIKRTYAPTKISSTAFSLVDIDPASIRVWPGRATMETIGKAPKVLQFYTMARVGSQKFLENLARYPANDMRFSYGYAEDSGPDTRLSNPKTNSTYQLMRREAWIDKEYGQHVKTGEAGYKVSISKPGVGMAERLASAFKHAIQLCQRQLREAPVPQKKELF